MEYLQTYELFGFNREKARVRQTRQLIAQTDIEQAFYHLKDDTEWEVDVHSELKGSNIVHEVRIKKTDGEFNTSEIYDEVVGALDYLKSEHNIKLKKVELIIDWSARGRGGDPTEERTVRRFPDNETVSSIILHLKA